MVFTVFGGKIYILLLMTQLRAKRLNLSTILLLFNLYA